MNRIYVPLDASMSDEEIVAALKAARTPIRMPDGEKPLASTTGDADTEPKDDDSPRTENRH